MVVVVISGEVTTATNLRACAMSGRSGLLVCFLTEGF